MNYRTLFSINAIIAAVGGAALLIMPSFVLTQLGVAEELVSTLYISRLYGGAMFIGGLLLFFVKDMTNSKSDRNIAMVMLAANLGGFVFTIMGVTAKSVGILRANGWVLLVIYGVLALAYGYFLFLAPKESKRSAAPRKQKSSAPAEQQ